jgi:hypothetical protein
MNPLYQLPRGSKKRLQAWKELVEKYEQSNLNISKFCQEQGVSVKTFAKWKTKFGGGKNTFIPVTIKTSGTSQILKVYEISHKNGFSLKCDDQANIGTVIRLLKAIGGIV